MKILRYTQARQAEIIDVPIPKIKGTEALGKSIVCNVSAGTEMGFYRGTAPQLNYKVDGHGLWEYAQDAIGYPMQSNDTGCWWMGYANVAKVIEVGDEFPDLKVGDLVFTQQGHKSHQILSGNYIKLPPTMNVEHASFIALIEICFNGILDATIKLLDKVVIIGMGTLGQLLVQMAKMSGAFVIAVDSIEQRLQLASELGADQVILAGNGKDFSTEVTKVTSGGADSVLEVTGNSKVLSQAVRCAKKDSQVTVLSFYQDPPITFQMGHEFHHKRIIVRSSQIGGVNPAVSFQYDRTRRRQAALDLVNRLELESLVSHRVAFSDYPEALKMIDEQPQKCRSVIIRYEA